MTTVKNTIKNARKVIFDLHLDEGMEQVSNSTV